MALLTSGPPNLTMFKLIMNTFEHTCMAATDPVICMDIHGRNNNIANPKEVATNLNEDDAVLGTGCIE